MRGQLASMYPPTLLTFIAKCQGVCLTVYTTFLQDFITFTSLLNLQLIASITFRINLSKLRSQLRRLSFIKREMQFIGVDFPCNH